MTTDAISRDIDVGDLATAGADNIHAFVTQIKWIVNTSCSRELI